MSSFHREVWCQPAVDWYWNISVVQASHRVILKYFCIAVQWNSVQWLARLYFEICVGVTKTCPLLWVRVIKQTFAAPAPPFFEGGWGGGRDRKRSYIHTVTPTLWCTDTHIYTSTHINIDVLYGPVFVATQHHFLLFFGAWHDGCDYVFPLLPLL